VENERQCVISNYALQLKGLPNNTHTDINNSAVNEIAMSGYTIGRKTIYKKLYQLTAGESLLLTGGKIERSFYYTYSPWTVQERSEQVLRKEFTETTLSILEQMVSSVNGAQIVVPLSAGNDSRLIVSGLKHLGVKDVVCFSYGRANSYESLTSRKIANKLGYQWFHLPATIKSQKLFFESKEYKDYLTDFDTLASVPSVQDISSIIQLRNSALISKQAVIVNGNSGDFITGGHIPSLTKLSKNSYTERKIQLMDSYLDKHYSLWGCLKSDTALERLKSEIDILIEDRNIPRDLTYNCSHGLIESIEYLGRQTKYVINQQNAYDFSGFEWRLPLWDDMFMDYWESVPVRYKMNQELYKSSLIMNNWGGVWRDIPVNNREINPLYLRWMRNFIKTFFYPLGKERWHNAEKNIFAYWLDVSCNFAVVPYSKVFFDSRKQRNYISWLAEDYLLLHGQGKIIK